MLSIYLLSPLRGFRYQDMSKKNQGIVVIFESDSRYYTTFCNT